MSKTAYKQAAVTKPANDRYMRCDHCTAGESGYGEPEAGTLLIRESLRLKGEDGAPSELIGRITRCSNMACKKPIVVQLFKAGRDMGVEMTNIHKLLKECRGYPTFRLHELYSGQLDKMPIPESLAAMMRPAFGAVPEAQPATGLFPEEVPF